MDPSREGPGAGSLSRAISVKLRVYPDSPRRPTEPEPIEGSGRRSSSRNVLFFLSADSRRIRTAYARTSSGTSKRSWTYSYIASAASRAPSQYARSKRFIIEKVDGAILENFPPGEG